jgi:hypothetical protein
MRPDRLEPALDAADELVVLARLVVRRMRLAYETALTRRRGEGAVAPAAVAMPLGKVCVEDELVPARGERGPVREGTGALERCANLRARGEGEAPFAEGCGERVDAD